MLDSSIHVEEKREIHLLDYWRLIWRGRWTVLSIFVIVVTLVAIGTFTQKPVYRAAATVEIVPTSRKVSPVADVAELGTASYGWFAEERYFNTQYEIIKSRDVSTRVFDKLDLYNHPRFKGQNDPISGLVRMIEVEPVKDTGIVEVSLEGTQPEEVATWVNAIADAYVNRNMDQASQMTSQAVSALLREIAPLKERLEDTQTKSFDFAEKANLYVPENQQKMTNERMSSLQSQLTESQVKRAQIESLLHETEEVSSRGGSYDSIQQIGNDPVIVDLHREKVQLERELEKLLVTYKDKHIRVLEKQSELDKINQKITAEANRVIDGLRTQLALLRDQEARLAHSYDQTKEESLQVNRKASSFQLVQGEATEAKRIYDLINTRVKEITLSSSLLANNLRILDRASVPTVPVKPRSLLNMAIGVMLGLFLGVGTVFFMDYIDNTIRTSEDVEHFLKLNLLAVVPRQGEEAGHAVREAYQTLRTSLLFSRKTKGTNTVLVTSAGPQEGKTSTIVNVARTLATAGEKVMVLDCDLRRPAVHQRLNLSRDGGITNYILASEGDDWRTYARATDLPSLYAITSGPLPPNPADVFGHERFQGLLKELRQHFDWIFIDSPPVVSLADAMILASLSDMVTFVVKHNENDREMIRRCVTNVRRVNPNIIGAVLNNVDIQSSRYYNDYYYVGYYYYGESSPKKGRKRPSSGGGPAGVSEPDSPARIGRSVG